MQSSQLREEASVWNVLSYSLPQLNSFGPVISPVVHISWFQSVASHIINIASSSLIWSWPIRKSFKKFVFLTLHDWPTPFFGNTYLRIAFYNFPRCIDISPSLNKININSGLTFDGFPDFLTVAYKLVYLCTYALGIKIRDWDSFWIYYFQLIYGF